MPTHQERDAGAAAMPDGEGRDSAAPEVEARIDGLRVRFGDQIADEQWAKVRERVGKTIEFGEKLRTVTLTNADEPEIVFVPYRGESR